MNISNKIAATLIVFFLYCSVSYAYYTTKGQNIVDKKTGETVILRGFGIGCWLLPEGYMWGIRKLDRPRQFEQAIENLIGKEDAVEFWRLYYTNFLTEGDIRSMKEWGVNSIRIALLASHLQPREGQPENPPYHYSAEGFALLDTLVSWCEKYEMGLIWDMHGAPGAQNAENISDSDGEARLWTEKEKYWPRCSDLWFSLANRYKDRECIIGYDLLNEPLLRRYPHISETLLRELYIQLTETIRKVDKDGIIFIEGDDWAQNFDMLEPLDWDRHLVIAFHSYPPTASQAGLQRWDRLRQMYNIPLWHGETGEQGPPYIRNIDATTFLEEQNVSWSWWTHKKFENHTQPWNCPRTNGFDKILAYWNGRGERPEREQAKEWLFDQARKTHTDYCVFLPNMVRSLVPLDPDGYLAAKKPIIPEIIYQPEDTRIEAGDAAYFHVRAKGYPLYYQWFKNGELVDGATEYRLRIANPAVSEDGTVFSARVYNELGASTSREVLLNIDPFSGPLVFFTEKSPEIDGDEDPCWKTVQQINLTQTALGERESEQDISAGFKALWDRQNLYLLITVTDDSLCRGGTESYDRDGIEFYVDSDNSKSRYYDDDDFQLRYNWMGDGIHSEQRELNATVQCVQRNTQSGYTMEIALPWEGIAGHPEADRYIGFDLHVNDNDGRGRECKLSWKAKRDNSYRSPFVFGTMKLVNSRK